MEERRHTRFPTAVILLVDHKSKQSVPEEEPTEHPKDDTTAPTTKQQQHNKTTKDIRTKQRTDTPTTHQATSSKTSAAAPKTCQMKCFVTCLRYCQKTQWPWLQGPANVGSYALLLVARGTGSPRERHAAPYPCFDGRERKVFDSTSATPLEALKWAREQGCPWDGETCVPAAKGGHLEVQQWAHATGCPWGDLSRRWEDAAAAAAGGGHLEVLGWAKKHGCPWNAKTCTSAGRGGHLEVLEWARKHGCPWGEETCAAAADGGRLEVLRWARAEGCRWNVRTLASAAGRGHLEVMKWAHANGCPWSGLSRDERSVGAKAAAGSISKDTNGMRECVTKQRGAGTWRC